MEPIELTNATPEYNDQLSFLIRMEFYFTYYKYRKLPYYLLGFTTFVIALVVCSNANSLITLKAILITLNIAMWAIGLIFIAIILLKFYKRQLWKKNTIKVATNKPLKFQIFYDKEKIVFITDTYQTELKWDHYKYFMEHNNSIFIFPQRNIYEAIYYSKNELGPKNYELLKSIVSEKLTLHK